MTPTPLELSQAGYALCALEPNSKAARYASWNEHPIPADAVEGLDGAGILHVQSKTCCLDVDDMPAARIWLAERGLDLDALLADDYAVQIVSGRYNRAKLVFRLSVPQRTIKPTGSGLELRSATADGKSVQDVAFGVHPVTKKPYEWRCGLLADWRSPPAVPAALLAAWREEAAPVSTVVAPPPGSGDVDRLRALLAKHDPSCGYELWLKAGMALHHATGGSSTGLAVWNEWSAKGKQYKCVDDLRAHWVSFSSGGGKRVVTAASLETEQPATADEFPLVEMDEVDEMVEKPKRGPRSPMALDRDRSGENRSNAANACKVLSTWIHDGTLPLAFDEFLGRATLNGLTLTDHDSENIWVMLQSKSGKLSTVSYDTTCHAINAAAHSNVVNCVKDWLTTLVWDGTPRLATWISSAFGSRQPSVYTAAVGRNWLVSMVARAFEAGAFVKSAIILESAQDVGKSSAFRALMPQRRWFAELLADSSTKDCEQQLRGLWLGEFAEGWFIKRTDVGRLKQFVANDIDRYRVTYGRNEQEHPRRCVFVVSLNPEHDMGYLKDQTGNCRFFPVKCTKIDIDFIKATREQLFAEAVAEYKLSPCWWQWPEAEALAEQEARKVREPLADYISDIPPDYALKDKHERRFITTKIVFEHLRSSAHLDPTEFNEKRIANALSDCGYTCGEQIMVNLKRYRPWYVPDGAPAEISLATDPLLM
jgi:putative DNA primase/helicase